MTKRRQPADVAVEFCAVCARSRLENAKVYGKSEFDVPVAPGPVACFIDGRWWRHVDAGGPYRALQYELGTRVVGKLKRENRVWPPPS